MSQFRIGFMGAGGIARSHAYSLQSLKFYYDEAPGIILESVTSARPESRRLFAQKYGFCKAEPVEEFCTNPDIDTVYILGPNNVHFAHLEKALGMPSVRNIYLEKPVCASEKEEVQLKKIAEEFSGKIKIQVGFQYLQTASVREALQFWKTGKLGSPVHFKVEYYHGDYLLESYREKRKTRLTPAPDGGAMADLGSHGISLLMAFLGENLQITGALQGGSFPGVPEGSDLFSSVSLFDPATRAVGNLSASRISSGAGDLVSIEIYAEKGMLRYSSAHAEYFEYFLEETGQWIKQVVGSQYKPATNFPSGHVPPGWLRSMVHAHYIFLGGNLSGSFIPDLNHGLAVQRVVRETAFYLAEFRKKVHNGKT